MLYLYAFLAITIGVLYAFDGNVSDGCQYVLIGGLFFHVARLEHK